MPPKVRFAVARTINLKANRYSVSGDHQQNNRLGPDRAEVTVLRAGSQQARLRIADYRPWPRDPCSSMVHLTGPTHGGRRVGPSTEC